MASLTTGLINNPPVAGIRATTNFEIKITNDDTVAASVLIIGYYVSGTTKTVYVGEEFTILPGSVATRNYFAQIDSFEFQFETSSDKVEISAWGKNLIGGLVAAHRVLPAELNSLIPGPSVLTGVGVPTCGIGQIGDIYIDTSSGQTYFKESQPVPPPVRPIPPPTGNTLLVGSSQTYTTIQAALTAANNGDLLLLDAETFNISATIDVNKSVTIRGQGSAATTVITTGLPLSPFYMFNVTVSDVVFQDMRIVQDYPRSAGETDTVIAINNLIATGIYIDNCEIGVSEFGIGIKATEFQITNCNFTYAPNALLNNRYGCILISSTSGDSIIYNNTFVPGSQNVGCFFVRITNIGVVGGTLMGKLLISNNTQLPSAFTLRHLLAIEEFLGVNLELYINNNTTISEGNVPVLLNNADFSIFKFIEASGNSVQNTAGKGLIGIDASSTGTTDIFSSNNTIANQFFTAGWASATVPVSFIVGYNTTITPAPVLPLVSCYWLPLV